MPFEPLSRSNRFSARIPSPSPLPLLFFFFSKILLLLPKRFPEWSEQECGAIQKTRRRDARLPPPVLLAAAATEWGGPAAAPGPVHRPRSRKRRCLRQKEHSLVPAPFHQDLGPDGLPDSVHVMTILLISRNSGIDVARRGEARCPRSGANMVQSPGQVYGVSQARFFPPIPFSSCSSSPCLFSLPPSLHPPPSLPPSLHPPPSLSASLPSFFSLSFLPSLPLPFSPSLSLSASLLSSLAQSRYSIDIFRAPIMCQGPRRVRCSLCF